MRISGSAASRAGDLLGKAVAVHRQRAARRQLVAVGRRQDQRAAAAHLLMQQADGVVHRIVGAEGVGADQLRQPVGLMRLGAAQRPHLMQHHAMPGPGELPGRFAAGEPAADTCTVRPDCLSCGQQITSAPSGSKENAHAPPVQSRPRSANPSHATATARVVEGPARWLHISGQVGAKPDGTIELGFEAQAKRCWANADRRAAGGRTWTSAIS